MSLREQLYRLVAELPDKKLASALEYLGILKDRENEDETGKKHAVTFLFDDEEEPSAIDEEEFLLNRLDTSLRAKDWGNGGVDEMEATAFVAVGRERRVTLHVGRVIGGKEAYGRDRVRYHVARGSHVIVEFTGTDDYDETGRVFSLLKHKDGSQCTDISQVPEKYQRFSVEPLPNLVDDGKQYRGLAVVVQADDLEAMAQYGLLRWLERHENPSVEYPAFPEVF
jgi:hypothetical protein